MKKQLLAIALIAALLTGFGITTKSQAEEPKFAVVEVTAVVAKSSEVQALKAEQQQKLSDLKKWLETVRADVAKQQTKEGQEKLIKKYDNEFAKKQKAIKADYDKKLQAIDKNITTAIAKEAKANGYTMVFAKGTVLYGGDDITQNVIKAIK